ncbi:MAG TPA: TlpA disulfide reductase family protein [Terriglobales bacterium]|nr:TlpA disulfide reductase family protein [Terriglobales bacterium]
MNRLLPLTLLTLLFMAGCYSGSRPPRIGSEAPDFTVTDNNRTVTLSQFKGKPVVLNFWATWCPPCVEEMPSLVQLQERTRDKVTVIAVSLDVDDSAFQRFLKDHKLNMVTVRDADQKSNSLYGTYKFPETYIIDSKGIIRRKFVGPVNWNDPQIEQYLRDL